MQAKRSIISPSTIFISIQEGNLADDLLNMLNLNKIEEHVQSPELDLLHVCNNGYTLLYNILFSLKKETGDDRELFVDLVSNLASYLYGENRETIFHLLMRDQTIPKEIFEDVFNILDEAKADLYFLDKNGKTAIDVLVELRNTEEASLEDRPNVSSPESSQNLDDATKRVNTSTDTKNSTSIVTNTCQPSESSAKPVVKLVREPLYHPVASWEFVQNLKRAREKLAEKTRKNQQSRHNLKQ